MVNCCVATCKSYHVRKLEIDDGIIYHAFPKDKALAKKWLLACKRKDRKSCTPRNWDAVCSLHFRDSDYERDLENELLGLTNRKRRFLKSGCIPSLNMPSCMTAKCRKPRSSETLRPFQLAVKKERQNADKCKSQVITRLKNKANKNGSEVGKASRSKSVNMEKPADVLNKRREMPFCKKRKEVVIDLSKKNMKILNYSEEIPEKEVTHLILDDNKIEKLPLISCFPNLEKISLMNNKVDDMRWFTLLPNLKVLDAPNNNISCIEALTYLCHLTHLNLSGNQIMSLEGYDPKCTSQLEYVDLSNNKIRTLIRFSALVKLKVLKLSGNMLSSLADWSCHLPPSVKLLELSNNLIKNLLDFRYISFLEGIETISIKNNPCVSEDLFSDQTGNSTLAAFGYRPYLLALCPTLKTIDEMDLTKTESSVADILKSEDRLQKFIANDDLVNYLSSVCPAEKIATDLNGFELKDASIALKKLGSISVQNGLSSFHQNISNCKEINDPNFTRLQLTNGGELYNLNATSNSTLPSSSFHQEVIIAVPVVDDSETEDGDSFDVDTDLHSLNEESQSGQHVASHLQLNTADSQLNPQQSTPLTFHPQTAAKAISLSEPLNIWDTSLQVQPGRVEMHDNLPPGCGNSCNHYIELIEEKAHSHLYKRVNDDLVEKLQLLAARNQQILDRNVQLEKILLDNKIPFEIKVEDDELL